MKKLRRVDIDPPIRKKSAQRKVDAPSAILSPTARTLKQAASEAENAEQKKWIETRQKITFIEEHGDPKQLAALSCAITTMGALIRAQKSGKGVLESELSFIAESIRFARSFDSRAEGDLLGKIASALGKEHPAAHAIQVALLARRHRESMLDRIQAGDYLLG